MKLIIRLSRRFFASEAVDNSAKKLRLSFVSPYQTIMKERVVHQVNMPTTEGHLGVLGGHVPSIFQLSPGVIDIINEPTDAKPAQSFFISGGFATVNPDSSMEISAMEACLVEHLDQNAIDKGHAAAEGRKPITNDKMEAAEIEIHQQVFSALLAAVKK